MVFKEIQAKDAQWARPLLEMEGFQSCEYNFVDIFIWKEVYKSTIARFEDFVTVRSQHKRDVLYYLYPSGKGDRKKALQAIFDNAMEAGKKPILFSIPEQEVDTVKAMFPDQFDFAAPRDQSDYVYLSEDLANLSGRKYQKKRNHCSRFQRSYPSWEFHEINADSLETVCDFNSQWLKLYDNRNDDGLLDEQTAIELACTNFEELKLKGGYITVGGEVVAYSFGSPLGDDMFVVHIEKALYDYQGSYAVINREMALRFGQQYKYINREDDVGDDGLRRAKLSYNPKFLVEKYNGAPRHWPFDYE